MSDVPRKLSEQELNYLGNKHISPKLLIDAAARLRYLEQRMEQAAILMRQMDDFACHNATCQTQSSGHGGGKCTCGCWPLFESARAFLAEWGE